MENECLGCERCDEEIGCDKISANFWKLKGEKSPGVDEIINYKYLIWTVDEIMGEYLKWGGERVVEGLVRKKTFIVVYNMIFTY